MGLLDFFKRKSKPVEPSSSKEHPDISTTERFLMVKSINFFGPFSTSPNGRYKVGCEDSDYAGGKGGGFRESGNGRCVLVEDERLLYQVDMERPWTAAVADNGIVALYDIRFHGRGEGYFHVLGTKGDSLIKHQVESRDSFCGLSPEGDLAWLHTGLQQCMVFAVDPPKLLFEIEIFDPPEFIERKGETFHVAHRGVSRIYGNDGSLLNHDEVDKGEVEWLRKNGSPYQLERKAEEVIKAGGKDGLDADARSTARSLLESALRKNPENHHKAGLHRKLGELAEGGGNKVEAVKQYTLAIEYDPKVGCKRALARLEKELR